MCSAWKLIELYRRCQKHCCSARSILFQLLQSRSENNGYLVWSLANHLDSLTCRSRLWFILPAWQRIRWGEHSPPMRMIRRQHLNTDINSFRAMGPKVPVEYLWGDMLILTWLPFPDFSF